MRYFIGVELGVENIVVGVVDKFGKLVHKEKTPTIKTRPYEEMIKDIATLINSVLSHEDIDIKNVKHIGVGCPGIPNTKDGTIIRNYTLNFINVPIRKELHKYFNLPVYVDNDANCAALAESVSGAAEDIGFSVMIRIGTGIGGGIIINNRIYNGFNSAGAELGHMSIMMNGEMCTCGREGCWEAYASGTALIKQTREAAEKNPNSIIWKLVGDDLSKINVLTAFDAEKQGDETGKQVVKNYLTYLSEGLINIVNILMPNVIIMGGEICKLGEGLLKPIRELVYKGLYSKETEKPEFKLAELGSAGIIIGAAMLGEGNFFVRCVE